MLLLRSSSRRQDFVAIQASVCDERGLLPILWMHVDLVVTRKSIHETKQAIPSSGIN
jgi:hypothetical protein